jgi:hypothetical protein
MVASVPTTNRRRPGTMTTPLSPAAAAVLDAFLNTPGEVPMPMWDYGRDLAAALRSAAEQLIYKNELGLTPFGGHCQARDQLLAIASELDHE